MKGQLTAHAKSVLVLAMLLVAVGALLYIAVGERTSQVMRVSFLDVGQGDATFIETPNGTQVLVDSGEGNQLFRQLRSQMPLHDRSLDIALATHGDADHIGAFPEVFDRFQVGHVIINGAPPTSAVMHAFKSGYEQEDAVTLTARRGQVIWLSPKVRMTVLFPDRTAQLGRNAGSVITRLDYKEHSFLFTGDAPQAVEEYLVSLATSTLDVDVLKVGHHGSDTSSDSEFLSYVTPRHAVIQAGKDNPYGHPHREVVSRLKGVGAEVLCTCSDGTIIFETNGETLRRVR